eukprot:TRINITY_DN4962_c0_g1_i3.p1 TRINITY_DN4962_c0_g1~~TRINITY_DN4962_c0_g1_i3.p1  ORF type:complete len:630 (+),score=106.32 TRINITY_DN4962_c0_g1_i3:136-2025(+)
MEELSENQSDTSVIESIKVIIRLRPRLMKELELPMAPIEIKNSSICIKDSHRLVDSAFDCVFGPDKSQQDVFDCFRQPLKKVPQGFNCTILAYGQTGSGKTHTIFGPEMKFHGDRPPKEEGIISRAVHQLFSDVHSTGERENFRVFCSTFQIYNEKIYDLLQDPKAKKPLKVRHDVDGGTILEDLSEYLVQTKEDVLAMLRDAERAKIKRQTKMNLFSSRSHTVFRLIVEHTVDNSRMTRGMLSICDLAGSEKWKSEEKLAVKHLKEMNTINLSLTTLGKVISAISKGESFVPFRESKLTRVLQSCFGNNNHTFLIANIAPTKMCLAETISTMKFADRAKGVMVSIKQNIEDVSPQNRIRDLELEIQGLNQILMTSSNADVRDLQLELQRLRHENERLRQICTMNSRNVEFQEEDEKTERPLSFPVTRRYQFLDEKTHLKPTNIIDDMTDQVTEKTQSCLQTREDEFMAASSTKASKAELGGMSKISSNYLKKGRCPTCTLPLPCKHYNNSISHSNPSFEESFSKDSRQSDQKAFTPQMGTRPQKMISYELAFTEKPFKPMSTFHNLRRDRSPPPQNTDANFFTFSLQPPQTPLNVPQAQVIDVRSTPNRLTTSPKTAIVKSRVFLVAE